MKDFKKYGFKYSAEICLVYLNELYLRKWSDTIDRKCYDYTYAINFPYPEDGETEERIPTSYGCIFFNNCNECNLYAISGRYNDI